MKLAYLIYSILVVYWTTLLILTGNTYL